MNPFPAVGSATLDAAIAENAQLLVDFWAEWCVSCKLLKPELEEVSSSLGIPVVAVDADTETDLVARFEVLSLPTVLLISGGEVATRVVGAKSARQLDDLLRPFAA